MYYIWHFDMRTNRAFIYLKSGNTVMGVLYNAYILKYKIIILVIVGAIGGLTQHTLNRYFT